MKSYLLFSISDVEAATQALDNELSNRQQNPWLLRDAEGDPVAYFDIHPVNIDFEGPGDPNGSGPLVMANISGRHYHEDAAVISVLRAVQAVAGGLLKNDKDEFLAE